VGFITYTEFVSADGLVRAPEEGRRKLLKDLEYSEIERPIVAQFFTSKPDMMEKAAALAVELGFDGVDINMGCPDQSIEKQGAGAALIKNPPLARELIRAAKRGVNEKIPVSVKTRLGYNKDELETWLPELLAENPAAIIIHARTRREMSKVPARWERIKRAVEIRDSISEAVAPKNQEKTLIIGNGDVESVEDAILKCEQTGADGAMLGRAIFGTPYLFSNSREWYQEKNNPEVVRKILGILVEHTHLFEEKLGNIKSFAIMKKHFKSYLSGLEGAKELKEKLMDTNNASEVAKIVSDFLVYNK
jgi:nifR3 family TIM-barrel protein